MEEVGVQFPVGPRVIELGRGSEKREFLRGGATRTDGFVGAKRREIPRRSTVQPLDLFFHFPYTPPQRRRGSNTMEHGVPSQLTS